MRCLMSATITDLRICVHLEAYRQKYVFIWKPIDAKQYFSDLGCYHLHRLFSRNSVLPVCLFMDSQMVSRLANVLSIISLLNRQMLLQFSLALYNTSIGFLLLKFEDLQIRKIVFFIGCLFCVAKLEVFSNVVQNFVLFLWPMVLCKVFQYISTNQFYILHVTHVHVQSGMD